MMFKIDIHTHIIPFNLNQVTDSFSDDRFLKINYKNSNYAILEKDGKLFREVDCNCWDHQTRINECKKSDVNMQVLSTIPALFSYWAKPEDCLILSKFINDHIMEICNLEPEFFLGLGTVPMQNIDIAINEIDRCINDLNLSGVVIGSNINNKNLSESEFSPIFEYLEKINCPIFIHPWEMMGHQKMEKYWLPWLVGMPAETSRAVCSIIFGGVLEKYPKLKIAFAHGGGTFPFTVGRIDHGYNMRPDLCAIDNKHIPSSYLKYFYVDSLVHDEMALKFLLKKMSPNQIALGSDYPFPLGEELPGKLIDMLDFSDTIKQRLFAGTALEWLGLNENEYIKS